MGTKLTNWMREAIVKAVVAHRFAEPAMAIVARRAALAAKVYDDLYSAADQKKMAALPRGWLPESNDMYVKFGAGSYDRLPFNGSTYGNVSSVTPKLETAKRRIIADHDGGCVRTFDGTNPICSEYDLIEAEHKELSAQIQSATKQAEAAVASVSTVKRLIDLWPEIEPFASKYEDEAKPNLPALPTAQLNALFKLPVAEAA